MLIKGMLYNYYLRGIVSNKKDCSLNNRHWVGRLHPINLIEKENKHERFEKINVWAESEDISLRKRVIQELKYMS